MTPATVINQVRNELGDTATGNYRWANSVLLPLLNDGLREVWQKRPDVRFDSNGDLQDFTAATINVETLGTDALLLDDKWAPVLVHYVLSRALAFNRADQASAK